VKNGLEIIPVGRMDEVLKHALVRQPVAIDWEEDQNAPPPAAASDEDPSGIVAH
jgi:ATP-dependent Lon protease